MSVYSLLFLFLLSVATNFSAYAGTNNLDLEKGFTSTCEGNVLVAKKDNLVIGHRDVGSASVCAFQLAKINLIRQDAQSRGRLVKWDSVDPVQSKASIVTPVAVNIDRGENSLAPKYEAKCEKDNAISVRLGDVLVGYREHASSEVCMQQLGSVNSTIFEANYFRKRVDWDGEDPWQSRTAKDDVNLISNNPEASAACDKDSLSVKRMGETISIVQLGSERECKMKMAKINALVLKARLTGRFIVWNAELPHTSKLGGNLVDVKKPRVDVPPVEDQTAL